MLKKLEFGRSMVEMLGVLAVMGVLSIGGIMGYQYSMTKRAANELANDLWIEAVNLSVQALQKSNDLKLASAKTSGGYTVNAFYVGNNKNAFEITVDGVPYDVCQQVLNMSWSTPPNDISVGEDASDECVKDASHIMNFVFDAGLQGKDANADEGDDEPVVVQPDIECTDDDNCGGCGGSCVNGKCTASCPAGQLCTTQANNSQLVGYTGACCPADRVVGNSCCSEALTNGKCCPGGNCCAEGQVVVTDYNAGGVVSKCCPDGTPFAAGNVCCSGSGMEGVMLVVREGGSFNAYGFVFDQYGGCTGNRGVMD